MNDKNKYFLTWSGMCFLFIAFLCLLFRSGLPLWLLIIWGVGMGGV